MQQARIIEEEYAGRTITANLVLNDSFNAARKSEVRFLTLMCHSAAKETG